MQSDPVHDCSTALLVLPLNVKDTLALLATLLVCARTSNVLGVEVDV